MAEKTIIRDLLWVAEQVDLDRVICEIARDAATEIDRLNDTIRLARVQYLGCGGNLRPEEIVENMNEVLSDD